MNNICIKILSVSFVLTICNAENIQLSSGMSNVIRTVVFSDFAGQNNNSHSDYICKMLCVVDFDSQSMQVVDKLFNASEFTLISIAEIVDVKVLNDRQVHSLVGYLASLNQLYFLFEKNENYIDLPHNLATISIPQSIRLRAGPAVV